MSTMNTVAALSHDTDGNVHQAGCCQSSAPNRVATVKPSQAGGRLLFTTGALALGLIAAPVSLALVTGGAGHEDTPDSPYVLPVRTLRLEPVSSYRVARPYTGRIVAARTSGLGFELSGAIESVFVEEGQRVEAGTPLTKLDTRRLEAKRRELSARRREAAARLAEMVRGPRADLIAAAQAEVRSRQAKLHLLIRSEERAEKLLAQRAVSQQEHEEILYRRSAAAAELEQANRRLQELLRGTREERLASQRAVVEQLDAAISAVEIDLQNCTLRAPFSGTVSNCSIAAGSVVTVGESVVRLVEDHSLEAWIGLPPDAAVRLAPSSQQRLRVGGRVCDARVVALLPEVDRTTGTRTVVLKLICPALTHVVHGQIVQLELEETVSTAGYWLPVSSLARGSRGLFSCYVAVPVTPEDVRANGQTEARKLRRVERRDVEVLHTEDGRVLVRGTIRAGELLIESGTRRVVPGQLVSEAE